MKLILTSFSSHSMSPFLLKIGTTIPKAYASGIQDPSRTLWHISIITQMPTSTLTEIKSNNTSEIPGTYAVFTQFDAHTTSSLLTVNWTFYYIFSYIMIKITLSIHDLFHMILPDITSLLNQNTTFHHFIPYIFHRKLPYYKSLILLLI